jgi:hypothetical protein
MQPDDFRADRDAIASAVKSLSVAATAEAIALLTDVIDSAKAELRRLLASQPLKFEAGGFFGTTGGSGRVALRDYLLRSIRPPCFGRPARPAEAGICCAPNSALKSTSPRGG